VEDKPKKSSSRRAAPKRKSKETDVPDTKPEAKNSKPRREKSDRSDKRGRKKSNDKRSESKRSGKSKGRDRNGLKENTVEGFGESMPAFFGSSLK